MKYILTLAFLLFISPVFAKTYYVNNSLGKDSNNGISKNTAFKSLAKINGLQLQPGDKILLASGETFKGTLELEDCLGTRENPILISSYKNEDNAIQPIIDSKNFENGILLENCSHVIVSNIAITGDGGVKTSNPKRQSMHCGILVTTSAKGNFENIQLKNLNIYDVFFEEKGFNRGEDEVRSANGTQSYGWGIRCINSFEGAIIKDILIENCSVTNVAHTGIKFTGRNKNIQNVELIGNKVQDTGGPGIQLGNVHKAHIKNNDVNSSGSNNDSRKWGRGSGLWTWGCSDILIENNSFRNANGPADSAGCHIDFNCKNIIVQYCLSENNAGGFCEILGNNYNCAYRYNISINDGHRVKNKGGASQEGKTFWLSGYVGRNKQPKGPFNSYFYNNTIYVKKGITANFAVANSALGVLIANNIFYIEGSSSIVMGDQYKPEVEGEPLIENIYFRNNLFLRKDNWPEESSIQDETPLFGNPEFKNIDGREIDDFIPQNRMLVKNKGIVIPKIPGDNIGLFSGLEMKFDILGNKIKGRPDLGAIELK